MRRNRTRSSDKSGLPPGTLIHVGERRVEEAEISIIDFDAETLREQHHATVEDCVPLLKSKTVTWIDIAGLHDVELIRDTGEKFDIHPLVMEDILNTEQRPKVQDLDDYLFVVMRMIRPSGDSFQSEQVTFILKDQCLITFQEQRGDVFESIRERIRSRTGRIRTSRADYLLYALLDAIVDAYFPYLESLSESLDESEEQITKSSDLVPLTDLHAKKRELIAIRNIVWPARDVVNTLARADSRVIVESTNLYLRDVYDHLIQIIETVESLRDVVSGLVELYLSASGHRMNEVMKVLTIIATIFIPLTFIAGVYGMNFAHMPELAYRWAYPAALGVMAVVAIVMVVFFKRRKWL